MANFDPGWYVRLPHPYRIIIASFKFIVTIASQLFPFKVEILESAQNYPFSEILSHLVHCQQAYSVTGLSNYCR